MIYSNMSFGDIYNDVYESSKRANFSYTENLKKSLTVSDVNKKLPQVSYGQTLPGNIIVFFMDIRGFTKISIALGNDELIRILQATTIASIYSINKYNGFVMDLTGDGIMAYFGDGITTNAVDSFNSLCTATYLMQGIKEVVNPKLSRTGDETIKIGIGLEYGNALWTRIGTPEENQLKPISEVTYISGKNSSHANAWEVLIGKNIAKWVPESYKSTYKSYEFERERKKYSYDRSLFNWGQLLPKLKMSTIQAQQEFTRNVLPIIGTTFISNTGTINNLNKTPGGSPRPLKDQPFFRGY